MKKIYEMPVVEITVFDVEDVLTTSVVASSEDFDNQIAQITDTGEITLMTPSTTASVQSAGKYARVVNNSYNW